jgi:electron transfer flavoprotein alpha subunit
MIHSKKIITINTDPSCTMFKVSDYGIVEDYKKVVPVLIQKLEELS